jgi:hypothetical protein
MLLDPENDKCATISPAFRLPHADKEAALAALNDHVALAHALVAAQTDPDFDCLRDDPSIRRAC